jgi:hypothetical protein
VITLAQPTCNDPVKLPFPARRREGFSDQLMHTWFTPPLSRWFGPLVVRVTTASLPQVTGRRRQWHQRDCRARRIKDLGNSFHQAPTVKRNGAPRVGSETASGQGLASEGRVARPVAFHGGLTRGMERNASAGSGPGENTPAHPITNHPAPRGSSCVGLRGRKDEPDARLRALDDSPAPPYPVRTSTRSFRLEGNPP